MLSRLTTPLGSSNMVENVSRSGGVSASHTVKEMPISGVSSSVTWAGMAEMFGGVFCCARIGGTAPNSVKKAQSTGRTIGAPWLQFALWRKQVLRSAQGLDLELGKENRRCGSFCVLISRPLSDLIVWLVP